MKQNNDNNFFTFKTSIGAGFARIGLAGGFLLLEIFVRELSMLRKTSLHFNDPRFPKIFYYPIYGYFTFIFILRYFFRFERPWLFMA